MGMDDLSSTLRISLADMKAQGMRLRVISENIVNAGSLPQAPGDMPYRRKIVTFQNELDHNIDLKTVRVGKIIPDKLDFTKHFDPNHPAADADGYLLVPNVNPLIKMMDMREAQRSNDANLSVIKNTKSMLKDTTNLLR
jgi:flagellar basal-body rod protein FlgC